MEVGAQGGKWELVREELARRKYVNQVLWECIGRCQYQRNCGVSAVTSCWNYLF